MPLCAGCQSFRDRIFLLEDHISSPRSEQAEIHSNYVELLACADSICELCMFFRRECWYGFRLWEEDSYQDIAEAMEGSIAVGFKRRTTMPLEICLGQKTARIHCFEPFYAPPVGTRDFLEIREANPPIEWSLEKCKNWLSDCLNHHQRCGHRGTDKAKFLPTRLLDVGSQEQQFIRLMLSKDLEESVAATYATLSYCWGATNDTSRTTKENLSDRLEGIHVETLPQTLQDAITVTRGLGIQYLWIDALCIIQGENGDWEKELLDVGNIYGQSLLTIAASSASNSNAGFLCRKNGAYWPVRNHYLFDSRVNGDDSDIIMLKAFLPKYGDLDESLPLSNRGWVLQERMLASRTLSWTDHGIFWLCGKEDTSEYEKPYSVYRGINHTTRLHEICEDVKEFVTRNKSYAKTESGWDSKRDYFSDKSHDGSPHLNKWYDLIVDLSKRSFTVASDRIPAITGLGKEIASIAETKFVNGMFKPTSARELCWAGPSSLSTRRIPGIPSWSWASLDQRISFLGSMKKFRLLARGASVDGQQIHICSRLGNLPVTSDGAVVHRNRWWSPRMNSLEKISFDVEKDALQGKEGIVKCVQWTTWSTHLPSVNNEPGSYVRQMLGIILLSTIDEEQQLYRRIGWAEVVNNRYFDKEFTDITII